MTDALQTRLVSHFGEGRADGSRDEVDLLGGKGANLAEMASLGLPVPPGFTLSTLVCRQFLAEGERLPSGVEEAVNEAITRLEELAGKGFDDPGHPLLLSVRSGAPVSMPGMMDTILNLGLNDRTVEGLAAQSRDRRFALDSYRRLLQMSGEVVLGIPAHQFEGRLDDLKRNRGVEADTDLTAEDLETLVETFKRIIQGQTGHPFPQEARAQLQEAIRAVFRSWNNRRAINYRKLHGIPEDIGTAVNVQTMVFGNLGARSGTGVAFTRNPSTGEKEIFGEYLLQAQGEDVVAGIRTPHPLTQAEGQKIGLPSLEEELPDVYSQLVEVAEKLERHYRDMQDLEFTVEEGKLYLLQTRSGKRTARAALAIAVSMVEEGLIDRAEAVRRIDPNQLDQLLHPSIDPDAEVRVIGRGLPASPGAATGRVVFDPDEAAEVGRRGERVILVRNETSPEDISGMAAAQAILTARGGMTSHAAVVARGMGKTCVVGCQDLKLDFPNEQFTAGGVQVEKGDWITVDGSTGRVLLGQVPTKQGELTDEFRVLLGWADTFRRLKVRTNADNPRDARTAREMGAEGIGLCRTEHMFFEEDRIHAMREMILAEDRESREQALAKLLPHQREDFEGIFEAMAGLPVTIRLLDPPLHEFLPQEERAMAELAQEIGVPEDRIRTLCEQLQEVNPMLGHRGCRLGISYPEITAMQTRAIFEAACRCTAQGIEVLPEVMIPLVGEPRELTHQAKVVREVADEVIREAGEEIDYLVGTMIELPRACLLAEGIAGEADFFSFGTNDLTQTTFGLSRDDAGKFLDVYLDQGLLEEDPFQVLDQGGVGELVRIAVERGREVKPSLKIGICGEHGGEPRSVAFCHRTGLDYVSCSPFRVPIARLAAAQAALSEER